MYSKVWNHSNMRAAGDEPQTGVSTPVAATSAGSSEKASRIARTAPGARRVSASTVITIAVRQASIGDSSAALSARALPPWATRIQCSEAIVLLVDQPPGAGSARPKPSTSRRALASVEPSSAITIASGGSAWASSARIVCGSTAASLRAATTTASVSAVRAPGTAVGGGLSRARVCQPTKASSTVS